MQLPSTGSKQVAPSSSAQGRKPTAKKQKRCHKEDEGRKRGQIAWAESDGACLAFREYYRVSVPCVRTVCLLGAASACVTSPSALALGRILTLENAMSACHYYATPADGIISRPCSQPSPLPHAGGIPGIAQPAPRMVWRLRQRQRKQPLCGTGLLLALHGAAGPALSH